MMYNLILTSKSYSSEDSRRAVAEEQEKWILHKFLSAAHSSLHIYLMLSSKHQRIVVFVLWGANANLDVEEQTR